MKKNRVKGRWLREVIIEKSPPLISGAGRRPSAAEEAAFCAWAIKDNKASAEQGDIRKIVAKLKPVLLRYLARELFKVAEDTSCGGFSEWHRVEGRSVLFLCDAYDVAPIAYAAGNALRCIAGIEAALSAGDSASACAASFLLGRLMQESDAHFAVERTGGSNRQGKMSRLFEYTKAVWREGLTAHELLAALPKKSAKWDSRKSIIRWRDARGKWRTTQEKTFMKSSLPNWKKLFREQVKIGS